MEEQSWNLERIQQLVNDRIPEDQYLEYKSERVFKNESFRDDLSKDVAAFANAGGGTLIIGIDEDKIQEYIEVGDHSSFWAHR